jgi:hypothetical protein
MPNSKKILFYAGTVVWFFLITAIIVYNFFPYQKLIRVAFQGFLSGSKMVVSIEGAKIKTTGAQASKILFGHEALKDQPLFEIEKVNIFLAPLSIVEGVLSVHSDASAYGGKLTMNVDNIPFIRNTAPSIKINFAKIDLSKYPENRLPWFKGISGQMSGWVKKEMPMLAPEKQKGSFAVNIQNGDIKELYLKNAPRLSLPFKEIAVEGRIDGDTIRLNRIFIRSIGDEISGSGIIESNDLEQKIDLKLTYEATSKGAPLPGKGIITVSGNQWSTDVNITPASQDKTDAKK